MWLHKNSRNCRNTRAVHEDANLNTLIDIFKETDVKVVVRDKEEQPVGTISKRILLEEIQGQAKK